MRSGSKVAEIGFHARSLTLTGAAVERQRGAAGSACVKSIGWPLTRKRPWNHPWSRSPSRTRRWFEASFEAPTPAQAQGWPAIASGANTLICAPTGSGKTLAAFLWGIDTPRA